MLTILVLTFASHFHNDITSYFDKRKKKFNAFLKLESLNAANNFLESSKSDANFVCLKSGKMNISCLEIYVHYFNLLGKLTNIGHLGPMLYDNDKIYSTAAINYIIVKSIYDDNPSLLGNAMATLSPTLNPIILLKHMNLHTFSGMPTWATEFVELRNAVELSELSNELIVIYYAIKRKSAKTLVALNYYLKTGRESVIPADELYFTYEGVEFRDLLPHLLSIQESSNKPVESIVTNGYVMEYFCHLSTVAAEDKEANVIEAIKKFALSHIEHHSFTKWEIAMLLADPALDKYSTLEMLKVRLKDHLLVNYLKYEPYGPINRVDIYYKNIDLITNSYWIEDLKLVQPANGISMATWKSFRGVVVSHCTAFVNCELFLTLGTSYYLHLLVLNSILKVKSKLSLKEYLKLLQEYDFSYTVLIFEIITQISSKDTEEILRGSDKPLTLHINRIMKGRHFCTLCQYKIKFDQVFSILPCGHVYHYECLMSGHNAVSLKSCTLCNKHYDIMQLNKYYL